MSDLEKRAVILDGMLNGLSYKEIAALLNIEPRTVAYHVSDIYRSYGVTSRRDLIAKFGHFEVSVVWIPNKP